MPKSVQNLSIIGDWGTGTQLLLITATSGNGLTDFPYHSRVNINGSFNSSPYALTASPGLKHINIEAYEVPSTTGGETTSFVYLNFGGRCPRSETYDFNTDGVIDAFDEAFIDECFDDPPLTPSTPKYRPSKIWQDGWFNNAGPFFVGENYACMNADYDGDCQVHTNDITQFCVRSAVPCT